MYTKILVIAVILKPFIPHDSSLIISVTCSHSSILSLLKTYIFLISICSTVVTLTHLSLYKHILDF